MKKTQIAVVGAGLIGREHISLIDENEQCSLAAVVDPTEESKDIANQHNVEHFECLDHLLQSSEVDGIILATPNHLHVEQAQLCINKGIPILIEKPVSHTVEAGRQLLQLAKQKRVKCLVGHHRYHSEILKQSKKTIDEGLLGEIVAITGSAMFYKPDIYFQSSFWRIRKGGGPILINLIHEIGSLRYLCGESLMSRQCRQIICVNLK